MALTMREKKAVTKEVAKRYNRVKKKEKGKMLDELVVLTGYNRCYASFVLRNWNRKITIHPPVCVRTRTGRNDSKTLILIEDKRYKTKRSRTRIYDEKVLTALKRIWLICDCICGKRLAPYLPEIIPILIQHEELVIDNVTKEKLLRVSAATIDRLLAKEKTRYRLKGRARTKPGTLLLNQIPIRTFADWNDQRPGFVALDLVSHDGGIARGEYCQTLDVTDVGTGWTETQAVKNKAEVHVFAALKEIRTHLPFPLLGIHSDNGTEFINDELFRYCQQEKLTFTRSRPYRKNDNCYVEQKNYSVVRRAVGYYRYQTDYERRRLNELYSSLRLYTNFFQPVMKLKEKIRCGSQVTKRYDCARTPYQRVLESSYASAEDKAFLKIQYQRLNPVVLKQAIERIQHKIMKHLRAKGEEELKNENIAGQPNDFSYKLNEATNVCFR